MRPVILIYSWIFVALLSGCAPMEKVATHDFETGYYKFKTNKDESSMVYMNVIEDSIIVNQHAVHGKNISVDTSSFRLMHIPDIKEGGPFYGGTFIKKSVDLDLATILMKYRPASGEVPKQLNANLNAAIYIGIRRDFYKMITETSPLHKESTYCRHLGFDFGLFAGLGITQINSTVTNNTIELEYDGIVFQKGIGAFITIDRMSVGIVLGFDNLLDKNSKYWLFNQQPYLGLSIGIANF
jgi:hypothetical protein